MCYTADGRQIIRFDTVFKGVDNIREAQVIQETVDAFTVTVVPTDRFNADDEKLIAENLRLHVGKVVVTVQRVAAIPRTAAGKFRAVICRLTPEEKQQLSRAAGHAGAGLAAARAGIGRGR